MDTHKLRVTQRIALDEPQKIAGTEEGGSLRDLPSSVPLVKVDCWVDAAKFRLLRTLLMLGLSESQKDLVQFKSNKIWVVTQKWFLAALIINRYKTGKNSKKESFNNGD